MILIDWPSGRIHPPGVDLAEIGGRFYALARDRRRDDGSVFPAESLPAGCADIELGALLRRLLDRSREVLPMEAGFQVTGRVMALCNAAFRDGHRTGGGWDGVRWVSVEEAEGRLRLSPSVHAGRRLGPDQEQAVETELEAGAAELGVAARVALGRCRVEDDPGEERALPRGRSVPRREPPRT